MLKVFQLRDSLLKKQVVFLKIAMAQKTQKILDTVAG